MLDPLIPAGLKQQDGLFQVVVDLKPDHVEASDRACPFERGQQPPTYSQATQHRVDPHAPNLSDTRLNLPQGSTADDVVTVIERHQEEVVARILSSFVGDIDLETRRLPRARPSRSRTL